MKSKVLYRTPAEIITLSNEKFKPNPPYMKCSSYRHRAMIIIKRLAESGDVEKNPGPPEEYSVLAMTYNVRGLNDEGKLRHLINACYGKNKKDKDNFFFFQETFITNAGLIPFLWRGNYHLTPGTGNSCGCLTLMSSHINVVTVRDIGSRAHVIVCQKPGENRTSYIVANIYAPCPNTREKLEFFEQFFEVVNDLSALHDCEKIIIGGDFNLNFHEREVSNRKYPAQERNIAKATADFIKNSGLNDIWASSNNFTWRRANSNVLSTIDRVLYSNALNVYKVTTDWALSMSDHAAVEAYLKPINVPIINKSKMVRLDPTIISNSTIKTRIESELERMLNEMGEGWNPHLKLEYCKMCFRTIVERVQAEFKREEINEEDSLNQELNLAISALENANDDDTKEDLIDYIEELRNKKAVLIEEKGKRLAEKLKTKWYNEGEKSTKYFLRLLNRSAPDVFTSLIDSNGREINDQNEIEKEIVDFYKTLYENYDKSKLEDVEYNDAFFDKISPVPEQEQSKVSAPITLEELGKTLASCKDSAPGPDGIPYSYYKAFWRLVGPILLDSWNYTLLTGNLAPSHKISFLKLIPKAGKDLKKLTNWRPITLSNCDHKVITKTYAIRMSAVVAQSIKERQTAYIKGRLINDNIRAMLSAINLTNIEPDLDGLLVSLDAKKAFDSVEHSYIAKCLTKFGLKDFVPIFNVLYSDLRSDIIINGKIVNGYKILRGVKQGDALSCILFIMCMEPLLLNIENNPEIEPLNTAQMGLLPKVCAYADDVNGIIKNTRASLQALFNEYNRLTKVSGLELNAEKTEIMRLNRINLDPVRRVELNWNITYLGEQYNLKTCNEIKINGILFQQDEALVTERNVEKALQKTDSILQRWSARHLSILGRILILKTFAISQFIFIMQSIVLDDRHFKMINQLLYKFVWNRHYRAAKAPERVKRDIVNTPINLGGFGMLDVSDLDKSLKLRSLGRLLESKHPFLVKVRDQLELDDFFHPKAAVVDRFSKKGIEFLGKERRNLIGNEKAIRDPRYQGMINSINLKEIVSRLGKNSLVYFNLIRSGRTKVSQISRNDLRILAPFIDRNYINEIRRCHPLPNLNHVDNLNLFWTKSGFKDIRSLDSKEIRISIKQYDPICLHRLGTILTPSECLTWGMSLKKVKCVKHKSILLRTAHGDIYTKEKLYRFGLIDSPLCPRCGQVETLEHKIFECPYSSRIWQYAFNITNQLRPITSNNESIEQMVLGATLSTHPLVLSVHAEIINRILYLKEDNFLLRPKIIVEQSIKYILAREKNLNDRNALMDLLNP